MAANPFQWTAAEVADFFRNRAVASISDLPKRQFPDMDALAQMLEANNIDGVDLMDDVVDQAFLREECNIKSFQSRRSIINCIKRLQAQNTLQPPVAHLTPQQTPRAQPSDTEPVGENVRSGEKEVFDDRGRKRRKLDLSTAAVVEPLESAGVSEHHLSDTPKLDHNPSLPGYLPDQVIAVDEVFFGNTAMGQEVGDIAACEDIKEHSWDDSEAWQIQPQERPTGQVVFVYKRIFHFLQHDETDRPLKRRGREALAILPYRKEILPENKVHSAMVIQLRSPEILGDADNDEAIAVRENATYLEADGGYNGEEHNSTPGQWDFMIEKYGATTDILPEYDPESASITSSLEEELAREEEDRARRRGLLSRQEVEDTVKDSVEAMARKWHEHKMPNLEAKIAWKVWKRMRRSKQIRDELIAQARSTIAALDRRLGNQLDKVLESEWKSQDKVREVCETMQVTVEDREEQRWKIDVWRRKQEPYHESRRGQLPSASKPAAKGTRWDPGRAVDPADRFSVEPATAPDSIAGDQQDEHQAFHTPPGSPKLVADGGSSDAEDEMDFVEDVETSLVMDGNAEARSDLDEDVNTSHNSIEQSHPSKLRSPPDAPGSARSTKSTDVSDYEFPSHLSFVRESSSKSEPRSSSTMKVNTGEIIEISSDSTAPSPEKKKKRKTKADQKAMDAKFATIPPLDSTASQIREWDMTDLAERQDRHRLLIKLLSEAGDRMRHSLKERLTAYRPVDFTAKLMDSLVVLENNWMQTGSNPNENTMIYCARLYLPYYFTDPSLWRTKTAPAIDWNRIIEDRTSQNFVSLLGQILQKSDTKLFLTPKKSGQTRFQDPISIDDSSDSDPVQSSPAQKRKQKLSERAINKQSLAQQEKALQRQEKWQKLIESQEAEPQNHVAMLPSGTPSKSAIAINPLKDDNEEAIYIDNNIAPQMKEHQIRGVQFMWRELTVDDGGKAQGCVLAHTMGLGKTVQTIAVLLALDEASRSTNSAVYGQLPKSLRLPAKGTRQLRFLVLCPAGLLNNWHNEIDKWASHKLTRVFIATGKSTDRSIVEWHNRGGILLMGYPRFRTKIPGDDEHERSITQPRKRAVARNDDIAQMLLEGPEVVVADEAHTLKRPTSGISRAARQFKTRSRIALTGTPMSNKVEEIYSLITWIHPEYLGDSRWFNANFATPIKKGMGKNSSTYEIRKGLKKLALLHRKIEPKVDRANIDVLRGSLTSKVEFHITLPITELQQEAYTKYISALRGGIDKVKTTRIFAWLALLMLLTNHPAAFKRRLLNPPAYAKPRRKLNEALQDISDGSVTPLGADGDDDEEGEAQGAATLASIDFDDDVIRDIVSGIPDDDDHLLSVKMTVLMEIVRLSRACGDKLIVFSQSLATLDYMSALFGRHGISHGQIDGRVDVDKRLPLLEQFENGEFDLMVIATKAGGTGLNIQTANRVVIMDALFDPAWEEQAIGRAYRLGQKKPVFVYRLVSGGTFEANIWDKQVFKTGMSLRVVDKKQVKRNADHNSREYLYDPKPVYQADLTHYVGMDKAVLDGLLNNPDVGSLIRHIETTEVLQAEVVESLTEEEKREVETEWQMERSGMVMNHVPTSAIPSTAPARMPLVGKGKKAQAGTAGVVAAPPASTARSSLIARLPVAHPSPAAMDMPHGLPTMPPSTMPPPQSRPR